MNKNRKAVNELENLLKLKMSPKRRKSLMSFKEKIELWARMEEGDVDALMELLVQYSIMSREDAEQVKKEGLNPI